MCICIHKPAGVTIPDKYLAEGFLSNPDGAGFAVCDKRLGFIVRKGFFTIKDFNRAFNPFRKAPALVHFRIATSGGVNPEMCHPFLLCGGKYALIHNGILGIKPHVGKSDTATFADSVLTPLLESGIPHDSPALRFLVEQAIGRYNKILIMDSSGKVAYFNEFSGHENEGIWYSNESYLPSARVQTKLQIPKWQEDDWKKWAGRDKGALLNTFRRCEYCGEDMEEWAPADALYCDDCMGYAGLK